MAFQEVPPNADISTVINIVNNLIRDLNNQEITRIYKSTDGKRAIIQGKMPNGIEGIAIAKPGEDVVLAFQ